MTAARISERARIFWSKPLKQKYISVAFRLRRIFPTMSIPLRLPFGAWWLAKSSALDYELMGTGFEAPEMRFMQKLLRPGMAVLDIGAHHGLHTLLCSKIVGAGGRVIAFEPSPRERERLDRHLRMNSSRNVRVEQVALGGKNGTGELFLVDGGEDWCNSLRPPAVKATSRPLQVEVRRLDDLLSELGVKHVDFVKLDVEGGELDVLKGASSALQSDLRPVILAEIYDIRTEPWGYAAREIVRLLAGWGYSWFALQDDGDLSPVSPDKDSYDANLVALPTDRAEKIRESLRGS